MRKMLAKDVQRATAMITNPTHYAVALEYRPETMSAPVVVAKGRNLLAERIKQSLAGTKFPSSKILSSRKRSTRPPRWARRFRRKLYAAVAEILAFLYRAQSRLLAPSTGSRELIHGRRYHSAPPAVAKKASFDWLLPVAAVGMVFMMLVPVPSLVLDLFLAASITLGVIVLLSALIF